MARTYKELAAASRASRDAIEPISITDTLSEAVAHYTDSPLLGFLSGMLSPKGAIKGAAKGVRGITDGLANVPASVRARMETLDAERPTYDKNIENAIRDSAALAKAMKVSEQLQAAPTQETVRKLLKQAAELPTAASARSKFAVRDLISTYINPAKRRIEASGMSTADVTRNMQDRGIFNASGDLSEGVVRVFRGQKSPYERLRTPVEIQSNRHPTSIGNHAVFSSRDPHKFSGYTGVEGVTKQIGTLPVSYPMYAKMDDSLFDATNLDHVKRAQRAMPTPRTQEVLDDRTRTVASLNRMYETRRQDWEAIETPSVQAAIKGAGFKGFITDEAGPSSNIGMFDPADFLSVFSSGKAGVSDIQAFLVSAGLAGAVAASTIDTKKSPDDAKD